MCVPTVNVDVVKVASPEARVTLAARWSRPSVNVTVPLAAVPLLGPVVIVTVAVNVTAWPNTDGFTDDVSAVAVAALLTVWTTEPLLAAKLAVPLYVARIVCEPAVSALVANVATPDALRATLAARTVAGVVDSSVNVTVPAVTGPSVVLTVAVNVTCWPTNDGLSDEARAVVVVAGVTFWVSCAELSRKFGGLPL